MTVGYVDSGNILPVLWEEWGCLFHSQGKGKTLLTVPSQERKQGWRVWLRAAEKSPTHWAVFFTFALGLSFWLVGHVWLKPNSQSKKELAKSVLNPPSSISHRISHFPNNSPWIFPISGVSSPHETASLGKPCFFEYAPYAELKCTSGTSFAP